jgi:hypothetical protein
MRWGKHLVLTGDRRALFMVLVGKPKGRRPLGRPRRRWEIILNWIFKKWSEGVDRIDLAQDGDRWRIL